jgi:hypothetical protein
MRPNGEREIRDLLMEALERQPQSPPLVRSWQSTGMSQVHLYLLSRLLEKKEGRE